MIFNSNEEYEFQIHVPHNIIKLKIIPNRLYIFFPPNTKLGSINLVRTVKENQINYTSRKFWRPNQARWLYHITVTSTVQNFKAFLRMYAITNFSIIMEEVNISKKIFGPDLSILKEKNRGTKPRLVCWYDTKITKYLIQQHHNL